MKQLITIGLLFLGLSGLAQQGMLRIPYDSIEVRSKIKLPNLAVGGMSDSLVTKKMNGNLARLHMNQLLIPWANINGRPSLDYVNTAATTAGNAVFYLTSDKTINGTALFGSVTSVTPIVNDAAVNYTYGWTVSPDKKTLTVNTRSSAGINVALLSLTLLGVPANVANGTAVTVLVKGI